MSEEFYMEGDVEKALSELYNKPLPPEGLPYVLPLTALPGFGMTSRVRSWAHHYNVNFVEISVPTLRFRQEEVEYVDWASLMGGKEVAVFSKIEPSTKIVDVLFTPEQIDAMDQEKSVIFLDDYEMNNVEVRKQLINLIRRNQVLDPREGDLVRTLKNPQLIIVRVHTVGTNTEFLPIEKAFFGIKD